MEKKNTFNNKSKAVGQAIGHGLTAIIKTPANAIVMGANMIVTEPMTEREKQRSRNTDETKTLGQGMYGFGKGIVMGVAGVVADPIKGARTGGFTGFGQGVVSGVIGVVSRPVKGVADLMESVDQTIDGTNRLSRVRSAHRDHFSAPLANQARGSSGGKLPVILCQFVEKIQMNGMEEEGIFRVPGNHAVVQETRRKLSAGIEVDFDKLNVVDVASLFKLWLRELPEPLIPFSHYSKLTELRKNYKDLTGKEDLMKWRHELREIIRSIPEPHKECLGYLMIFLNKVSNHCSVNKMTCKNLAIVLAPNLLYEEQKEVPTYDSLKAGGMNLAIDTIAELIKNMEYFFWPEEEETDTEDDDCKEEVVKMGDGSRESDNKSGCCELSAEEQITIVKRNVGTESRRKCQPPKSNKGRGIPAGLENYRPRVIPPPPPKREQNQKRQGSRRTDL